MTEFRLFKNYGVLGAGKRAVYSVGTPIDNATCYDVLDVKAPKGCDVCESASGELCVTIAGTDYLMREVLCGDANPYFRAWTPEGGSRLYGLRVCAVEEH